MIEIIVGFLLSSFFTTSIAYVIGSIILGFVTAYLSKAKPRDSIVAVAFFTVLSLYQFFFRFFDDLAPERIIGHYIYMLLFLASTYIASRVFYRHFEEEEIRELLGKQKDN